MMNVCGGLIPLEQVASRHLDIFPYLGAFENTGITVLEHAFI